MIKQKHYGYYAIICPLMIVIGGLVAVCGVYPIMAGIGTLQWSNAPGEIISADMSGPYETTEGNRYVTDIWYKYWVNGEAHVGNNPGYGDLRDKELSQAQGMLRRYPVGAKVRIRYRADSPDDSVLVGGISLFTLIPTGVGLVAVIAGIRVLSQCGSRPTASVYHYKPTSKR